MDEDYYVPDEETMARHKAEREAREDEWLRKEMERPPLVEMVDYLGNPIPEPPEMLPGEDMSTFFIPHAGSLAELMLSKGAPGEEEKWACDNVYKPGSLTLVLGAQQSLKSWSMLDLAFHAAKGTDWLGHSIIEYDHVLYVSNEKSEQAIYERFWLVFKDDVKLADKVYIRHRADRISFGNDAWKEMVRWVHEDLEGRVLIILDTLTSLAPAGYDENNLKDVSKVLSDIRSLQQGSRIDVMLVHHLNAMGERPRGHTALDGEVDGFVKFDRKGRDIDEVLVRFEPKDGLPATQAYRFDSSKGTFRRASARALHVASLVTIIGWWQERNNGEGLTINELKNRFFTGYRWDQIEKEVHKGVEELALKREKRRSMISNREAEIITVMTADEKSDILSLRRKVQGIETETEVRVAQELKARDTLDRHARAALSAMPEPVWDGIS